MDRFWTSHARCHCVGKARGGTHLVTVRPPRICQSIFPRPICSPHAGTTLWRRPLGRSSNPPRGLSQKTLRACGPLTKSIGRDIPLLMGLDAKKTVPTGVVARIRPPRQAPPASRTRDRRGPHHARGRARTHAQWRAYVRTGERCIWCLRCGPWCHAR